MSENSSIPYLSANDLAALDISTADVIDSIEAMIRGSEQGSVWSAPKAVMMPGDGRYMMAALAAADDPPYLAVKTVVLNPENSRRNLPQINGLVTMLDSSSGLPAAILDGNWITAVRTAGLSATAAKYLAREDASVVAFVGTGVQASSHLDAFNDLFPLERIRIFGRGQANIDRLAEHAQSLSLDAEVCKSGNEALEDADLVVTSITWSPELEPFLDAARMKAGAFAAVTDLAVPWIKESFAALDRVVIDDVEQEAALDNKLAPPEVVDGDLSGLVLGRVDGRGDASERTAFLFRGHALGDLALSGLALEKSRGAI
jgi:ornithine cyclodeaminase/alanine dehydrogenase-like protein (mu-crystallin family)